LNTIAIKTFWSRRFNQTRKEGLAAVWQKAKIMAKGLLKLPIILPIVMVGFPVVIIVRLLRPLVTIRFGRLYSDRIGHFAGNTEMYLCERDAGIYGSHTYDIFYCGSFICNHQLKKMWDDHLHIFSPAIVIRCLSWANQRLPGAAIHTVKMPSDQDANNYLSRLGTHLTFTTEEESIGKEYLKSIGISSKDKFVCFCSRDARYLADLYSSFDCDCSYHNFRDASIYNHVLAVEMLSKRMGYYAIRMGHLVKDPIHSNNPKIIDYSTNGDRSEFLDIYLAAKCNLFVNSGSGISALPRIFRRPMVAANLIPLEYVGENLVLFIPKKLWLKEEARFMTFREIFDSGAGRFLSGQQYESLGIEPIENSPAEIKDAVIEADERIRGTWRTTEEDEYLQSRFLSLFPENVLLGERRSRIGADFLRQNKELLE